MDPKERKEYEYKRKRKPREEGGEEKGEEGEELNAPRTKSEESNPSGCNAIGLKCSNPTLIFYMNSSKNRTGPSLCDQRQAFQAHSLQIIL